MPIKRPFNISGVGKFLPEDCYSSATLERQLDLPQGWIEKHLGVATRYRVNEETNTIMGAEALKRALQNAQLEIHELDCLIGASATFDHVLPNRSALIKHAFEEAHQADFPCLDINTVCLSFVSALDYASMLLQTGTYRHIAIVSSEISSKGLNPEDVETYGLFGDGAAAVIVSATTEENGLLHYALKTYAESAYHTLIEGGGNRFHPRDYTYDPALYSFKMAGSPLLRTTATYGQVFLNNFFDPLPTSQAEVDWIIPHQASKNGLKLLARLNQGRTDNIINYLSQYGNCIAASIPLSLVTAIQENRIQDQQTCLLIGTASGLSIGGLLLKYSAG